MVLNNEFSIIRIGQLTAPAVAVFFGGDLIVKGNWAIGGLIFLVGVGSYIWASKIIAESNEKIAKIKAKDQANRFKIAQENRKHSIEKAELKAREMLVRRQQSIDQAEQHTHKIKEKALLTLGKKLLDDL